VVYIGNTVIGTGVTLVDSFSAAGNTMVTWTTVSKDTNNTRYKKSTLDSFNDGSSISFTESAIIRSDSAYPVATFTSNITNGTINLWAAGDSASVTVTYERRVLGSFSPTGYINNFGPIGPAGSIAQTSSNIVTVATSAATSTTTGALQVAGGAGIAGNLYTGGNLVVGANLTVLGNLIVQGEVTTLNTTILAIEDLNITVAKDAVSSAAADGAGITVGGAGATFNYVASTDAWTSNKTIYASAYYTGGDTKWSGNSAVYRSGINYTPSATAHINSNYGDQWYDTTTDILYEWQTADGVNGFWIDIGSLAIVANANLSATTFASITTGNVSASNVLVSNSLRITQSGAGNQYALTMKGSGSGDQWAFTVGSSTGQNNITSLNSAGSAYAPFSINGSTFTVGTTGAGATTSLSVNNAGNLTVTSGNILISSTANLFIGGNQTTNGPAFSAYANNTLQTITSGSQQKVLFQVEEFDTNNNFSSSRFTPTVAGYYQLNAEVRLDGSSGTGEIMIVIWKNGAEYKRGTNQSGTSIATNFFAMTVSSLVYANGTTDYFEIYVQQTSGVSLTVTAVNAVNITWFNGAMVRGA
jgi:hypothetical protein